MHAYTLESQTLQDATETEETVKKANSFILLPTWTPVQIWEAVIAIVAMFSSVAVIFQAAIDGRSAFSVSLIYIWDFIYILGILSHLLTGYQKEGVFVTDFKDIFKRNLKSTLIVDIISTLPIEMPAFAFGGYNGPIAAILRLNRAIRIYRMWYLCIIREAEIGGHPIFVRLIRYTYLAFISIHIQACIWYAIACDSVSNTGYTYCTPGSWANSPKEIPLDITIANSSTADKYVVSLYWSVATVTTTGYGDIYPLREGEKWFAVVSMLWGIVMFGYILGGVASILTNQDAQRSCYVHRLDTIKKHLKEASVSQELQTKVIGYYEYLWLRNKGKDGNRVFEELPSAFQAELSYETYQNMLLKSELFRDAPKGFIRLICTSIKQRLYLPKQVIINKGDIVHNMYFIHKGTVEVLSGDSPNNSEVLGVFKKGALFGEINIVYSLASQAWVRARDHCDILMISKRDVTHALRHFPSVSNEMKNIINIRFTEAAEKAVNWDNSTNRNSTYSTAGYFRVFSGRLRHWLLHDMMLPGDRVVVLWDVLIVIAILFTAWLYSFQASFASFNPSIAYSHVDYGALRFTATYILDLFLILDIFVTFKKAIVVESGYETCVKVVAISYIVSPMFLLDVLAILPIEIGAVFFPDHRLNWAITLKNNRVLKLWKVVSVFNKMESSLRFNLARVRTVKFILYVFILTHLMGCVWFGVACYSEVCRTVSWANNHISLETTAFHDYLVSLYWAAATTTSVGYGDITAVTSRERIVSIVAMVIGLILYGYILGAIAATIANSWLPKVTFQGKLQAIHQFMKDNSLSKGLLERVDEFYDMLWNQTRGEALPGKDDRLFGKLPQSLQEDIGMEEYHSLLSNVNFLENTDEDFMRQLTLCTRSYLFAPTDMIIYHGDIGTEMYCIRKGYVEVLSEDLSEVVTVIGPGGHFGELGFLYAIPRTVSVRAATHCELAVLEREDLNHLLESFPIVAKQFQEIFEDISHLEASKQSALEASQRALSRSHHQLGSTSVISALAKALNTSLAVVTRTPLTTAISSTAGSKDIQFKISSPSNLASPEVGTLVKYCRHKDGEFYSCSNTTEEQAGIRFRTSASSIEQTNSNQLMEPVTSPVVAVPISTPMKVLNALGKIFSYLILPFIFVPQSISGKTWEIVSSLLAVISVLTITVQSSFFTGFEANSLFFWVLNYALDVFFICDIALKIHSAYYSPDGVLITKPVECAKNYFKTNFIYDFIGSFPTELFLPCFLVDEDSYDIVRMLSLLRLNRVFRVYKLPLLYGYFEEQVTRSNHLLTQIKFASYLTMFTHIVACIWFMIACASLSSDGFTDPRSCKVDSWVFKQQFINKSLISYSISYQYIVSLYWAATTTVTVGYGDIHADNDNERFLGIFATVFGILSYGYVIATLAASLANAGSGRARYQEKLKAIQNYLQDKNIDIAVTHRVVNYYEYIWKRTKGTSFGSLFHGMPITLQADISLSLYKKSIDQVPLFQNTEIGFTKLLALHIKPVLYLRDEYIVRKGDIGSEMFIINRGSVKVVSEDGEVVFSTMKKGNYFGEISLLFSCPRTASIRAATNCDLFVLKKQDLDACLCYYPHIGDQIREVAGTRANLVKKRSEVAAKAVAKGMTATEAANAAAEVNKREEDSARRRSRSRAASLASALRGMFSGHNSVSTSDSNEDGGGGSERPYFTHFCDRFTQWIFFALWPRIRPLMVFIISPVGRFGTVYSYAGCLMAYLSFFTITYQVFYQSNSPVLWVVNYMVEFYFLIEIFIRFHLGYLDDKGHIVADSKSIALHYLKQPLGFPLDLIAILPYEIIPATIPDTNTRIAAVLYTRIIHTIRIIRIRDFFNTEEKRLNQNTVLTRLLKFIVLISVTTHSVACVWYLLGCNAGECNTGTWAEAAGLGNSTVPNSLHYCDSLYWAVATLTTTGYGDYIATNAIEMIYSIFVMILGKLMFGFILGSIASTLANLESQRVLFEDKVTSIKHYMSELDLPKKLQLRVVKFFEYLWVKNKGVDTRSLFDGMPECLLADVSLATTGRLLKKVPIFASASPAFLRHLSLKIKPWLFLPDEYIVQKGDIGYGMFFIYYGCIERCSDDGVVVEVLQEGDYFGLSSMVDDTAWDYSYKAGSHCQIFALSNEDYVEVLKAHCPTDEAEQITNQ